MATRDELMQIWYADANGVVTGYTPNVDNVASAIIDTYNEHFGTDIGIWTPETKNLQVGGTVPNWSAYEKIYGDWSNDYYILLSGDYGPTVRVQESVGLVYIEPTHGSVILTDANGVMYNTAAPLNSMASLIISMLKEKTGIEIETVEGENLELVQGEEIPDASLYNAV